jgi:hypothetical protein
MVVRLQTANGRIKEYKTTYPSCGGEGLPNTYHTKCGRKWDYQPSPQEECDHLKCAISIVNADRKHGPLIAVFFFVMSGMPYQRGEILLAVIFFLLPAFYFLLSGLRAGKRFKELTEYRDRGTINGIKACQIFEDMEGARTGLWWLLRKWSIPEIEVRLETEDGEIKEYPAVYGVKTPISGEFSGFDKLIAKFRRGWNIEPEPGQECDYLECAIRLVKNWRMKEVAGLFLAAIGAMFFAITAISEIQGKIALVLYTFTIFICSIVLAICCLSLGRTEKERLEELTEFKNNGTINGIRARQISEDSQSS